MAMTPEKAKSTGTGLSGDDLGDLLQEVHESNDKSKKASNGQVLIGKNGSKPVWNTITPGNGITVTNGPGTIQISSNGGGGGGGLTYREETLSNSITRRRIYVTTGTLVGATPAIGATLSQAYSGSTGTITAINATTPEQNFDINMTGTPDIFYQWGGEVSDHDIVGINPDSSTFTFKPATNSVVIWQLAGSAAALTAVALKQNSSTIAPWSATLILPSHGLDFSPGFRYRPDVNQIESYDQQIGTDAFVLLVNYAG